jgi:hypothetical protein
VTSPILVGLRRIVVATGIVVAALASASGVIDAVSWAMRLFGTMPVAVACAFIVGAILMHGIDHALALSQRERARRR